MQRLPDEELARHARSLRALARRLVGAEHADDLVQDAAAESLQRGTPPGASPFAWLVGIVRNRARRHHRTECRRREHERRAVADEAATTPLDGAAQREAIARLDRELLALPQPYQDTLLLRYYENLTPTEIAARTGTPVATVKSRLQRGITMLRERLDAGGRGDWRAALVGAFGIDGRFVAPGTLATAIVGISLMTTKLLLGAALAVLSVWIFWPSDATPTAPPDAVHVAASPAPERVEQHGANDAPQPVREPVERHAGPPTAASLAAAAAVGTIVGRAVDETGAAVAGAQVSMQGERTRQTHSVQTDADGRFMVAAPLRDGEPCFVKVVAEGHCTASGHVNDTGADTRIDLGDVLLPRAYRLLLRAVDERSRPQAGVEVSVHSQAYAARDWDARLHVSANESATSDDAGRLQLDNTIPSAVYRIESSNRTLLDPDAATLEIDGPPRDVHVDLVVAPAPPRCVGVVVREDGTPIEGALVGLDADSTRTDASGRFELEPDPSNSDRQRIVRARHKGFEDARQTWQYGDRDELRIVLPRSPGLVLHVVDGASRHPVESYRARLVPFDAFDNDRWADGRDHPGGRTRIAARPDDYYALVEPTGAAYGPSRAIPVRITKDRDSEITVPLWPVQQRRLVVTDGQQPVAGVAIELLDAGELQVPPNVEAFTIEEANLSGVACVPLLQRGVTDEHGSLPLRGPAGPLALRLQGGGVALQIVRPVRLDEPGDLVVAATAGASVRGRLVPGHIARDLIARAAGDSERGRSLGLDLVAEAVSAGITFRDRTVPTFQVGMRRQHDEPFAIAPDGSFHIDGVPPGIWHLLVLRGRAGVGVARLEIAAGQQVVRDIDVSMLAIADVTLHVRVDGLPAARTRVNVLGWGNTDSFGKRLATGGAHGNTDEHGTFTFDCYTGDLMVHVYLPPEYGAHAVVGAPLTIAHPGPQEHTIDVRLAQLELRLLLADDRPAAGVDVYLGAWRAGVTDDQGRVPKQVFAAGNYAVKVKRADAPHDAETRLVGTIELLPGEARPTTLRLPADWGR